MVREKESTVRTPHGSHKERELYKRVSNINYEYNRSRNKSEQTTASIVPHYFGT